MRLTLLLFVVLLFLHDTVAAQQLLVHPTIESIGVEVSLPSGYDSDQNAQATLRYRKPGENWQEGFPLSRIVWNGASEFRGSVFRASPGALYEVEITLTDSMPVFSQQVLSAEASTRPEPEVAPTANIKYVSPNGAGTAYSLENPGKIQTLLAAPLGCGVTIMLRGGEYAIGDLQISLTQDCSEAAPIVFMAYPGESPVFNGGDSTNYTWTPHPNDPDMYWTTVGAGLENGAMCIMDGQRLFPYASLTTVFQGYPTLSGLQYGHPGYYRRGLNYFIKTPDGKNPNGRTVVLSRKFNCFRVYGNNKRNFLKFKGLTFKYYGKGSCNYLLGDISMPTECFTASTLDLRDVNDVLIDGCTFWFNNNPIVFGGNTSRNVVQNCYMYDQTGKWSHGAFKQSRDNWTPLLGLPGDWGSLGRYLENGAVVFQTGTAADGENVVRKNRIDGYVGGITSSPNSPSAEEYDVSDNDVTNCYDAIESVSGIANHRVWGNRVSYGPVGISMSLPDIGPYYVFFNVFDHLGSRFNYLNPFSADGAEPHWLACDNTGYPVSWSTGVKVNIAGAAANPGDIFFINNTFHGIDSLAFNMYLWNNTWRKLVSRNNIFFSSAMQSVFFDGIQGLSDYYFTSGHDNYFSPEQHPAVGFRPLHGNPLCQATGSVADIQPMLQDLTESPNVSVWAATGLDPQYVSAESGDFSLQNGSPLIDKGLLVHGINDRFLGAGPDVGAFEQGVSAVETAGNYLENGVVVFPNPTRGAFTIRAATPIKSLEVIDLTGRVISRQTLDFETVVRVNIAEKGMCWVKIINGNGGSTFSKVVILGD